MMRRIVAAVAAVVANVAVVVCRSYSCNTRFDGGYCCVFLFALCNVQKGHQGCDRRSLRIVAFDWTHTTQLKKEREKDMCAKMQKRDMGECFKCVNERVSVCLSVRPVRPVRH